MNWVAPKYGYGDHVRVVPLDRVAARVVDLHFFGNTNSVEYDVRFFLDGKESKARVFEDELEAC